MFTVRGDVANAVPVVAVEEMGRTETDVKKRRVVALTPYTDIVGSRCGGREPMNT